MEQVRLKPGVQFPCIRTPLQSIITHTWQETPKDLKGSLRNQKPFNAVLEFQNLEGIKDLPPKETTSTPISSNPVVLFEATLEPLKNTAEEFIEIVLPPEELIIEPPSDIQCTETEKVSQNPEFEEQVTKEMDALRKDLDIEKSVKRFEKRKAKKKSVLGADL